ncbi:trans-Golgi network integral membrane protein TGN38-like isoform X1 [Diorhabda carinulata]|uniref:trans-Golgi network integral membrane protein TGN38-like isoform X1 n=1 Tax=Diorhabda carinulata TaxID=1163345 RepID=UPI0025A022FD|nr:trans-Golgi network integral membrane protein TGN38-like isoform X1 [Diorhabda carinulata]
MELSLTIYLIFGISTCLAAPVDKPINISSICTNSSDLLTNQGDIFKNCSSFIDKKNTLCTLYYNSLSSYCQSNKSIVKYPTLEEIKKNNYDIEAVCTNLVPSLQTLLKKDIKKPTCYYLCSTFDGIKLECLYAYYYNISKNMSNNEPVIIEPSNISQQVVENIEHSSDDEKSTKAKTGSDMEKPLDEPLIGSSKVYSTHKGDVEVTGKNDSVKSQEEESIPNPVNTDQAETTGDQQSTLTKSSQKTIANHDSASDLNKPSTVKQNAVDSMIQNSLHGPGNGDPGNDDPQDYLEEIEEGRTSQQDALNKIPQQYVVPQQDIIDTPAKQDDIQVVDQKGDKKPDFVQDSPVNSDNMDEIDGESYFFTYFMVICILFILGYVGYHNRLKVFALLLEGKRGKRQHRGRRPNSANYHKLDTNLEEAISSNVNKNPTNVIF